MDTYEVRVTQTVVKYYKIDAKDAKDAEQKYYLNQAKLKPDDEIQRATIFDYAVQLSPEGEPIYK